MLCSKECGGEAEVFYRVDKVLYPLCVECYLGDSQLPQKIREYLRGIFERRVSRKQESNVKPVLLPEIFWGDRS